MLIDPQKYKKVYGQTCYYAKQKYHGSTDPYGALAHDQEEYKESLLVNARNTLELDTWPEHLDDPMYILQKAIQPFGAEDENHEKQNLVSYPNYTKWIQLIQASSKIQKEAAAALYDIYFGDDDERAFTRLSNLLNKKVNDPISIASFYFFLKNENEKDIKYVTARKEGTRDRLKRLLYTDKDAGCVEKCTWDNYKKYLSIVKEIQGLLAQDRPGATLLDAQSFLWMVNLTKWNSKDHDEEQPRVLFCNIAWMEAYDQINFPDDKPRHGGSYVKNTGAAYERLNFHRYDDGYYYGFVETKYTGETALQENANLLHIEKIDPVATGDTIDNVTVVFCAHSDAVNNTVIVGWYENATVLRNRKQHADGHIYNIFSPKAILLPEILRTEVIPRARLGSFGFGQSNVRFASGDGAAETVVRILAFVKDNGTNAAVNAAAEKAIANLSDDELKNRAGEVPTVPASTYTATATLRKRNPYLPEIAKRRADGICQLCGISLDYSDSRGRPYLEAHHIIPLAEDGFDSLNNMVALCPNCHRKMHVVRAADDIEKLKKAASSG